MRAKIGIIGCGNISGTYFDNVAKFRNLEMVACADINTAAAQTAAEKNKIAYLDMAEIVKSKEIDILVNLTIPKAHVPVSMSAVEAGKHVYCEKPLGVSLPEAKSLLDAARAKKLRVGCAPDTFLGGSHQTCRKIIDDGWIGRPVAGTAFMLGHGPEGWHPNPFFFYEKGAGPIFDMGPYYLTALVNLLGPVKQVMAKTAASFPERTATSEAHFGKKIPVQVSTHASGVLEFASGALITVVFSWDIWAHTHTCIEIYGSEGSLQVPDPNGFGGAVRVRKPTGEWHDMPLSHGYTDNSRIIGVADMASAVSTGRPHRASGDLAYHVLEIMCAFDESSKQGKTIDLASTCERPAPLPVGLLAGEID